MGRRGHDGREGKPASHWRKWLTGRGCHGKVGFLTLDSFLSRYPAVRAWLAPAPPPLIAGEMELKHWVPAPHHAALSAWLALALRPHPLFPRTTICSVYFDTPELRLLEEKRQSDFHKTKHRIRWYAGADGQPLPGPAWLETKQKFGNLRRKTRRELPFSGEEAARRPLSDPWWCQWAREFSAPDTPGAMGRLLPLLEVRYLRQRAVHPLYPGASFCFDSRIHCPRVHPCLGGQSSPHLTEGVFEQKSPSSELLPPARPLPRFGAQRSSFSKYERLMLRLLGDPDSIP